MQVNIWKRGRVSVTLTTESTASHYGVPVLRVKHPSGNSDLGPADICPRLKKETPGTAASLLACIHFTKPLTGDTLKAAQAFLAQWPDGPQIGEPPMKRLTARLSVQLTRKDLSRLAQAEQRTGLSRSELLRRCVKAHCRALA